MYKYSLILITACLGLFAPYLHVPISPVAAEVATIQGTAPSDTLPSPTLPTFHIVLVPGHKPTSGGGDYLGVFERDVAVDLAQKITDLLKNDSRVHVTLTRDKVAWNDMFSTYFANEETEILAFKIAHQAVEKELISTGKKKVVPDMAMHSVVDKQTAIQLYGLNKWANEHDVDLLLHIHFNDSGRTNRAYPGTFKGFSVYVPESQLPNSVGSYAIAEPIFQELKKKLTPELGRVTGDQSLIALGASATLSSPSILIEYGYIYEKPLRESATRNAFLDQLAAQTVAGIDDYLASIYVKND